MASTAPNACNINQIKLSKFEPVQSGGELPVETQARVATVILGLNLWT
jgi:hypothetical protein